MLGTLHIDVSGFPPCIYPPSAMERFKFQCKTDD